MELPTMCQLATQQPPVTNLTTKTKQRMAKIPKTRPITRSFHCPECDKRDSPKKGDVFVTLGSTGRIKVHEYNGGGVRGITPHIIVCEQESREQVKLLVSCTIHDCGVDIFHDETFDDFEFDIMHTRTIKMPKADWEALKLFKEKNDYYI